MKKLIACLLAFGLAVPASAQRYDGEAFRDSDLQTGSRFKRAPENASQSEARQMQRRVARCVFDRNEDESRKVLQNSDFSRIDFVAVGIAPDDLFDELNVADCIGRAMSASTYRMQMRIPFATLRNLLAEEAYLEDYDDPVALASDAPMKLESRYGYAQMDARTSVVTELGDCIVHTDSDGADAFLRARPGSKKEAAAIEALSGALGECLGNDAPPEVGASMMRQVVADGLWSRGYYGPMAAAETPAEAEAE